MRESISYSFLLNIVILFVFTCFAIVMGILSYYKAFKANTIISETIEKYEGYNCVSAEEIATKLGTIGYGTPFDVTCNGKGENCMTDTGQNYAIISYNLDDGFSNARIVQTNENGYEKMNSSYKCDSKGCTTNRHYQYGVYTYMYVDLPVISSLIRIPFFSKTSIMYEFRNFYLNDDSYEDEGKYYEKYRDTYIEAYYNGLYSKEIIDNKIYVNDASNYVNGKKKGASQLVANLILNYYSATSVTGGQNSDKTVDQAIQDITSYVTGGQPTDYRTRWVTSRFASQGRLDAVAASQALTGRKPCGYIIDYSKIN